MNKSVCYTSLAIDRFILHVDSIISTLNNDESYFQSKRLNIYTKYIKYLIKHEYAYPCF